MNGGGGGGAGGWVEGGGGGIVVAGLVCGGLHFHEGVKGFGAGYERSAVVREVGGGLGKHGGQKVGMTVGGRLKACSGGSCGCSGRHFGDGAEMMMRWGVVLGGGR